MAFTPPACGSIEIALQVQRQAAGQAARAADHHDLVGAALALGQYLVPMVRNARQHAGFAGAAYTCLAGIGHVYARVQQGIQDAGL